MTEETIAHSVRKCLREFSLLTQLECPLTTDSNRKAVLEIAEEVARFKIWSGNIGAHSTGRRSLQYRLRDASHLQKQVKSLLGELSELLGDAYAIAACEKVPWDQAEDDELSMGSDFKSGSNDLPATEMGQIYQNVSDVIDCLLRLSVAIRNPAPHDRFAASASIDASHYEPFDIEHVKSNFSEIAPFLADRLGRAISRRREYFKYRESHHTKLSQGLNFREANDESTVASSLPQRAKAAGFNVKVVDEDEASNSGVTQTSFSSSHTGHDKLRVPPLPREAESGPFECPFCYMMVIATSPVSWKRHVFADLRPYVCLSKGCTASEMEFMRRREWILHEVQAHWKAYPCPFLCGVIFPAKPECRDHISKSHPDAFPKDQVDSMIDLSSRPIKFEDGIPCPFCKERLHSVKEYQRHAGRHQEQLALFALPSIETVDEDAQPEDDISGTHSKVSSDSHRYQAVIEDEHGTLTVPPQWENDDDDYLIDLEGAGASFRGWPSPGSQDNGENQWEAFTGARSTKISGRAVYPEAINDNLPGPPLSAWLLGELGDETKPDKVGLSEEQGESPISLERREGFGQHETTSYTSDRSQSGSHSVGPASGDDVLVAYLENGRNPDLVRAASREILPREEESDHSQNSGVLDGDDDVKAQLEEPEEPVDEFIRRFDQAFYRRR